jgi:hypothetical protein
MTGVSIARLFCLAIPGAGKRCETAAQLVSKASVPKCYATEPNAA